MTDLALFEKQKETLSKRIKKINNKINTIKSENIITCAACGHVDMIKNITLIDVEYYVEPYSCSGGDYWKHSEYNYNCSSCSIRNRFLFNSYYHLEYYERERCNIETLFFNSNYKLFKDYETYRKDKSSYLILNKDFVNNYSIEKLFKPMVSEETYLIFLKGLEKRHLANYIEIPENLKELI